MDLNTPATVPAPDDLAVNGFVCIDPQGQPFWPSARATIDESLYACFGNEPRGSVRLHRLAEEGWRCIPIEGGPAQPIRKALAEADKQAESGLCCFKPENMRSALVAVRRAAQEAGVQGGLTGW